MIPNFNFKCKIFLEIFHNHGDKWQFNGQRSKWCNRRFNKTCCHICAQHFQNAWIDFCHRMKPWKREQNTQFELIMRENSTHPRPWFVCIDCPHWICIYIATAEVDFDQLHKIPWKMRPFGMCYETLFTVAALNDQYLRIEIGTSFKQSITTVLTLNYLDQFLEQRFWQMKKN